MVPLVLAAGFGNFFLPTILVVAIISWFITYIQDKMPGNDPRAPKPGGNPQPKPQGPTNIEDMLRQLAGDKKVVKPQNQPAQQSEKRQPPQPKRQTQRERPRGKPVPPVPTPPIARAPLSTRQKPPVHDSNLPISNLGTAVASHHLADRVDKSVQREIVEKVDADLGRRTTLTEPAKQTQTHPLVKLLRDPNGVRQAILLNEILQPPKSRRR